MKARYSDPAAEDLEESISYFRDHASSYIADFADAIDHAVALLVENPYLAQEIEMPGVRRWYIQRFKYSIFYSIRDDELLILHIRHAARRPPGNDINED
jgi:toxin ParE1/3/4